MYDQPRYEPLEPSAFFEDGTSARPLVAGTVPRDDPRERRPPVSRKRFSTRARSRASSPNRFPFPVDRAVLERGQDRFRIFCTPCHGELGDGRGMIVRRGFNPPPPYSQRRAAEAADRPLLRCDDPRVWDHVFLRLADSAARPMGHRGVHPGASTEPARRGRQPPPRIGTDFPPRMKLRPRGPSHDVSTNMIGRGCPASPARPHPVAGAGRWRRWGSCLSLAAWVVWPGISFLPSYLVGYVFWVGIGLGCMGLTMLHHLVGGSWGLVVRRPLESGGMTLLPLALLFLPLALGLSRLYPWARPEASATIRSSQHKSLYLNERFS